METPVAWLAATAVIASMATVGRWYWQSPRDLPESVALVVHSACCAGLLALLRWAPESAAIAELVAGVILGLGVVATVVATLAREDR